jgi:Ca2+-transporting ATPase
MRQQHQLPAGNQNRTGLTSAEVAARRKKYGPNRIAEQKGRGPLLILAHQFSSLMMLLLVMAATFSFVFRDWLDGTAIVIVIVINILIGFWMELQAARSMQSLRKLVALPARVVRDGGMLEIPAEEVVPGDLLFAEAGDMIPADALVVESAELQTEESALTGESLPVSKVSDMIPADLPLAERRNMIFKGTYVTRGNGYAIVQTTGMQT